MSKILNVVVAVAVLSLGSSAFANAPAAKPVITKVAPVITKVAPAKAVKAAPVKKTQGRKATHVAAKKTALPAAAKPAPKTL